MHCVSNYPVTDENSKLGYISYLKNKWNCKVGYSSHDSNWENCLIAISMGAQIIERHITINKEEEGLDHTSSSTIEEFKKLCNIAKKYSKITDGNFERKINQGEKLNKQNLGRCFYYKENFKKGHILTKNDIVYRVPKVGIDLDDIDQYVGETLQIDVEKEKPVQSENFTNQNKIIDYTYFINKKISIPVRLHDYNLIRNKIPTGFYELHLSFEEIMSNIDYSIFNKEDKFSIHLPDYINSNQLIDPIYGDTNVKKISKRIIKKTNLLASYLESLTNEKVYVVGSFSKKLTNKRQYFQDLKRFIDENEREYNVTILPQWLPPIAWYFGGSVPLDIFNNDEDIELINELKLDICLDVCHLILSCNYFNLDFEESLERLKYRTKHLHLADAYGIDGEGVAIGKGALNSRSLVEKILNIDTIKVLEIWQGHLNSGQGFIEEIQTIERIINE